MNSALLLENDKIRLRHVEPEDLEKLYLWENDPLLWGVSDTHAPFSRYAIKRYIAESKNDIYEDKQLRLIIEDKVRKETLGTVDLFDFDFHNSKVALGLFVDASQRGKGYATQALMLIENYVFDFLKINQLYVHVAETNEATIRIFHRAEYRKSAVLKQWIRLFDNFVDVFVLQKLRTDYLRQEKND